MVVKTAESALNLGGVIESYLRTPVIKLATDGTLRCRRSGGSSRRWPATSCTRRSS